MNTFLKYSGNTHKLIEFMDKFKKILLFLLELEEQTQLENQEISKMVNMKKSMVHTTLNRQMAVF